MKLKKLDKSSQGFIDPDILTLLDIINKKYTTTSSCSGRITIIKGVKKGEVEWLYKTHTKASAVKIYDTGSMETIVTKDLSKEYISFLVKEANKRLNKTKENIKKLEKLFS